MILRNQLVEIGRYNKPHGVCGELSATLDCDDAVIKDFSCLISEINGIFVPFFVESVRPKSSDVTLLKIEDITNEDEAQLLVNKYIYVNKQEFENVSDEYADDAMPLDYFIGFNVYSHDEEIGVIVDVNDETENCLFVVDSKLHNQPKQVLIPANDDFICDIDLDKKAIEMDIPNGLIEL